MSGQLIGDLLSVGGKAQEERDRLASQLSESERLRTEAFQACEAMRLERNDWKRKAEYQQEQATQLRLQVEALEASLEQEQGRLKVLLQEKELQRKKAVELCETMRLERDELRAKLEAEQQASEALRTELAAAKNEASKSGWVVVGSHLPDREQLDTEILRLRNNWSREIDERKALQQQVADLQAQLAESERLRTAVTLERNHLIAGADHARENVQQLRLQLAELQAQLDAAAVTPTQQPDGNAAEQLERVQQMIGHVLGWYACTDWFDEVERAEAWEQVGALLGRLQREAD